jgi:hypothetical protein
MWNDHRALSELCPDGRGNSTVQTAGIMESFRDEWRAQESGQKNKQERMQVQCHALSDRVQRRVDRGVVVNPVIACTGPVALNARRSSYCFS